MLSALARSVLFRWPPGIVTACSHGSSILTEISPQFDATTYCRGVAVPKIRPNKPTVLRLAASSTAVLLWLTSNQAASCCSRQASAHPCRGHTEGKRCMGRTERALKGPWSQHASHSWQGPNLGDVYGGSSSASTCAIHAQPTATQDADGRRATCLHAMGAEGRQMRAALRRVTPPWAGGPCLT
jgi:hypothetical protein